MSATAIREARRELLAERRKVKELRDELLNDLWVPARASTRGMPFTPKTRLLIQRLLSENVPPAAVPEFQMQEPEPNETQVKELQQFMETENQKAVIQAAISKLTETCFDKCVAKPGNKLDSSEANCIANCAGRYLDSSVFVVNRMMAKRQQQ